MVATVSVAGIVIRYGFYLVGALMLALIAIADDHRLGLARANDRRKAGIPHRRAGARRACRCARR